MNTDTLDQATDAELNELFSHEVAGWIKSVVTNKPDGHPWMKSPPIFATDANAVLPWLEKCGPWKADQSPPDGVWVSVDRPAFAQAYADTFARAACLALIRARRAGK